MNGPFQCEKLKFDGEVQIISFVLDLYRQRLCLRGVIQVFLRMRILNERTSSFQSGYSECLGDLWGGLISFKYDDVSQSCTFYQSLFLLANLQVFRGWNDGMTSLFSVGPPLLQSTSSPICPTEHSSAHTETDIRLWGAHEVEEEDR